MRSRYYRTSTIGHNTIVINGQSQPPTSRAAITRISFGEEISCVVMDLTTAYPSAVHALRGFALIDHRHVLIVDEIAPNGCLSTVDWQMHTEAEADISAAVAVLTYPQSEGTEPPRFHLRVIDPGLGSLSRMSASPPAVPPNQNPNTGIAKLVFHLEQVAQPLRLAVLLSPDGNLCATPDLPAALRRPLADWVQPGAPVRRGAEGCAREMAGDRPPMARRIILRPARRPSGASAK
jgi:hypothetical protein